MSDAGYRLTVIWYLESFIKRLFLLLRYCLQLTVHSLLSFLSSSLCPMRYA